MLLISSCKSETTFELLCAVPKLSTTIATTSLLFYLSPFIDPAFSATFTEEAILATHLPAYVNSLATRVSK